MVTPCVLWSVRKLRNIPVKKTFCMLELNKINSITVMQWHLRIYFRKSLPTRQFIRKLKQGDIWVKVNVLGYHEYPKINWSVFMLVTNTTHKNLQEVQVRNNKFYIRFFGDGWKWFLIESLNEYLKLLLCFVDILSVSLSLYIYIYTHTTSQKHLATLKNFISYPKSVIFKDTN